MTRIDSQINFQWTLFGPDPEVLNYDFWSVRWTGKLIAPVSGTYNIGIDGNDGYRLSINEQVLIDNWIKRGRDVELKAFSFKKEREYDLLIVYYEPVGNAWFSLVWDVGIDDAKQRQMDEAVTLARNSDLAIVAVGIEEGEFRDRAYLNLPGRQEELILKVAQTGTPVVVLLVGGSAITMNSWMDKAGAIVNVWYPGEAGGVAVAGILFGDYSPAGRLPITWPVFEGQLPLVYNHKPTGRGDDYLNLTGQPLFPFGFGLSYTSFEYSDIRLSKSSIQKNDTALLTLTVKNLGKMAGDEVVQLYVRDELASVARPVRELKAFRRIHLKVGERKTVSFEITPEMLSMYDLEIRKVVEPGTFRLIIGASSKDIRQRIVLNVVD